MADEEIGKLLISIEADVARLDQNLKKANRVVDGKLDQVDRRVSKSEKRFKQWGQSVGTAIKIGIAAAVVAGGRAAIITADRINIMQDRIKDATRESGDFEAMWSGIEKTAIDTGTALEGNVALVQRLSIAASDLGGSTSQVLQLNDTVQKLGIISGASSEAINNATLQLSQGLGAGTFRAEEFNSVLENTPAIAEAIAKSLGKSTGELRQMVLAGELTSKMVFDALLNAADDVEARFTEIPPKIQRAWQSVLTAISLNIDELNDSLGVTESIAEAMERYASAARMPRLKDESLVDYSIARWRELLGLMDEAEMKQREDANPKLREISVNNHPSQPIRLGHHVGGERNKPDATYSLALRDLERMMVLSEMQGDNLFRSAGEAARISAEFKIQEDLLKAGVSLTADQQEHLNDMLDDYQAQIDYVEELNDNFELLENTANQFAQDFGDVFINSVSRGTNAIDGLKNAFKNALIKMAADALIVNPLKNLFSPSGGNLFGALFGGLVGGIPGRATGGPVTAGQPYYTGENGKELFIPKTSGTIVPNHKLSNGGGTTFNVNVDARGAMDEQAVENAANRAIIRASGQLISASEQRVINNSRRPMMVGA